MFVISGVAAAGVRHVVLQSAAGADLPSGGAAAGPGSGQGALR